jgi:UPF0042 nucleotide-binding protein
MTRVISTSKEEPQVNQDKSYELLIVTGMSGAGRSTVGKALEDMDWYVVDNLPPQMIKPMAELFSHADRELPRLAVVIDARGGELFLDLSEHIDLLRQSNVNAQVLFLEANDATLVKRYEQVRRPHPLQGDGTITDGIAAERLRLLPLREQADYVIDSSELNVYQLAAKIADSFSSEGSRKLNLMIQSFGFKYGSPSDADAIADMRVTDQELMYVAMYITIKSQPVEILYRMVELGEQIKWELNNNRQNRKYIQDELF